MSKATKVLFGVDKLNLPSNKDLEEMQRYKVRIGFPSSKNCICLDILKDEKIIKMIPLKKVLEMKE